MYQQATGWLFCLAFLGTMSAAVHAEPDPQFLYDGQRLSEWIQRLNSRDVKERRQAAEVVAALATQAQLVAPALVAAPLPTNTEELGARLKSLVQLRSATLPALIQALWGEDKFKRAFAIYVLREIGPPAKSAVPSLIETLKDEDPAIRRGTIEALAKIGAGAATSALIPMLQDKDHRCAPGRADF
jgi:HEAT repeat protein